MTARQWKEFYRQEREQLGESGLLALFDRAPRIEVDRARAIVFPHTKLRESGYLVAAVAQAAIASNCQTVLALGVLHRRDREDPRQRRVHHEDVEADEFSLDNFRVLLEIAARRAHARLPRVIARYPFLTGENPTDLYGIEELRHLQQTGAMLVATTDPIHHGVGYGTPIADQLTRDDPGTLHVAQTRIAQQLDALARGEYVEFLTHANAARSDFRDVGPVLAELCGRFSHRTAALELVDYADALHAAQPTWVAAALITITQ